MTGPAMIIGAGARTALGRNRQSSAAAVRCAIAAFDDYPELLDRYGMPIKVARDTGIDPGLLGADRLTALAIPAAFEAIAPLAGLRDVPPVTLLLSTGEARPGQTASAAAQVAASLQQALESRIAVDKVWHLMAGHAGGTGLLDVGARMVADGRAGLVLAGGVDSYLHPATLDWLDVGEQLHSEGNIYGFCPGEAAGFVLVATVETFRRIGVPALLTIISSGSAFEPNILKGQEICLGKGLSQAFQLAAEPLENGQAASRVICDMNGERYRANEYGLAALRVSRLFMNAADFEAPADCWGDVGAASGPLHVCLTIEAEARGYSKGPLTLIWASSESGQRSAALLGRVRSS
jgi:3-oxoacyl-[acyl-carrier-protein] synthase-1